MFRKAVPYEGSARVPLILAGPPGSGISAGRRIDSVAGLQDVMPTLLDCAGLPIPQGIDGTSLLAQAKGASDSGRTHLHGEHTYQEQAIHWLTDGQQKYIWFSGTGHEQLFDLVHDPNELHNLAHETDWHPRLTEWRRILIALLAQSSEGFSDGQQLVAGQDVSPVLPFLNS